MSNYKSILLGALAALVVTSGLYLVLPSKEITTTEFRGVTVGNEYNATSTSQSVPPHEELKIRSGAIGSVIVWVVGTESTTLYNATTTDVNKRTGNISTSSLEQIVLPASLAVGEYALDAVFDNGIIVTYNDGSASTTITWR